jgi:hypothetical protein
MATLVASMLLGCAPPAVEREQNPIIYDGDDRLELFAHPDPTWRDRGARSAVAILAPASLDFTAAPTLLVRAAPLRDYDRFCADVRFLDQPAAAVCSGTLIDDDLVLTAGHCLETVSDCRELVIVTDYRYQSAGALAPLTRENVFGCRRLAVRDQSPPDSIRQIDVAILQLDRAVPAPHRPAALAPPRAISAGDAMTTIGCPERVPLKIDSGGRVRDARAGEDDYFTVSADAFSGSSGSGVFDAQGRLAGTLSRGGKDYQQRGNCQVARIAGTSGAGETATQVQRAIEALCATAWPGSLCATAPSCGDDVCSSDEDCPADCPPPRCGDRLCERAEWDDCPQDCDDRRAPNVPNAWVCEEQWYADGETCDCACGVPDPDCGSPEHPRACDKSGPAGHLAQAAGGGCAVGSRPTGLSSMAFVFLLVLGRALRLSAAGPLVRRVRSARVAVARFASTLARSASAPRAARLQSGGTPQEQETPT